MRARGAADPQVLQEGNRHTVCLEPDGSTVRKTFHGPLEAAQRGARREYDRLLRFSEALQRHPHVSCPRPLELCLDSEPFVRMERAAGEPMVDHLTRVEVDGRSMRLYGEALAEAALIYVQTFGEPYWDLHFRNMFVSARLHALVLMDFDIPDPVDLRQEMLRGISPLDVTLGNLVGSTIFNASRPNQAIHLRLHRQSAVLAAATVAACRETSGDAVPPVNPDAVLQAARASLTMSGQQGNAVRRGWYRTAGRVLATHASRPLPKGLQPLRAPTPLVGSTGATSA